MAVTQEILDRFAANGTATVYEASGREGLINMPLTALHPGARVAGTALPVMCGPSDNLMVHACIEHIKLGDVVVLCAPDSEPVALIGDLLYMQIAMRGAVGILVDAAVRDVAELKEGSVPTWTRHVRAYGATKDKRGTVGQPVTVGGATVARGDVIVLDDDGAVVVSQARYQQVLYASDERTRKEERSREAYRSGVLSLDQNKLRHLIE